MDFGQHQQVIFVTHYDSLSQDKFNYAPGADDAMSGGSALIEALRLFKDYGFRNTVKIIFFSGEEQGLCGSVAYTRQHPAADMWRVVNMDQTAYDGDLNRLMDVYNWSLASSPQSVALGDAFVQANSDYGSIIDPAKIVRDTTKMCQTDHCPFWNVGVAAIAVTEDLHNNDICPCFDNTDTATCHDSLTQVDPNHSPRLLFTPEYSWPSEKAAIATVAALAEPLYACPPSAPAPAITPGNNILHVAWPTAPGVTNYVLEKAATCAGPFTALLSTPGTAYDDVSVANGTSYAYRVRTCPTQTSACVTATPVAGPSVVYQSGSAVVTADSGDHDNIADNCELVTVSVNLVNDGNAPLTGVKLTSVSSSHPGVQLATAIPQGAGSLGVGASAPAQFKFYLGRSGGAASCGESIPFTVTASSDQAPQSTRTFSLSAERDLQSGAFSYGFESDLSGWTVTTGTFTRVAGGAPGSTGFSLHSRNANSICDAILSPIITPTASSAMTMYVNYSIESGSWDRAVVRAINPATGTKTLLVPTLAPYTTTGTNTVLCDNLGSIQGWAGSLTAWTQASFNLSAFAGTPIQIEVRFSTDGSVLGTQGFWFDNVQITNATQTTCDAQANVCAALPAEVSPGGDPVPFTLVRNGANLDLRFSEVAGATAYEIYGGTLQSLHGGAYDHVASGGICALTDAPAGDGQVTASVPLVGVRRQQLPPGGRAQRRRRVTLRVLLDGRLDPALAPELSVARSARSERPPPAHRSAWPPGRPRAGARPSRFDAPRIRADTDRAPAIGPGGTAGNGEPAGPDRGGRLARRELVLRWAGWRSGVGPWPLFSLSLWPWLAPPQARSRQPPQHRPCRRPSAAPPPRSRDQSSHQRWRSSSRRPPGPSSRPLRRRNRPPPQQSSRQPPQRRPLPPWPVLPRRRRERSGPTGGRTCSSGSGRTRSRSSSTGGRPSSSGRPSSFRWEPPRFSRRPRRGGPTAGST